MFQVHSAFLKDVYFTLETMSNVPGGVQNEKIQMWHFKHKGYIRQRQLYYKAVF